MKEQVQFQVVRHSLISKGYTRGQLEDIDVIIGVGDDIAHENLIMILRGIADVMQQGIAEIDEGTGENLGSSEQHHTVN